jgi:hypothetical protein
MIRSGCIAARGRAVLRVGVSLTESTDIASTRAPGDGRNSERSELTLAECLPSISSASFMFSVRRIVHRVDPDATLRPPVATSCMAQFFG